MITFLAFIFVLSVLILIHEFGHFIVAKRIGVRVEKFSLGFGPKLIGFRKGETEYMISAFPLGGYVKMSGENADDEELQGEPWEFASRSIFERAKIVACGPAMNVLLAMVLMVAVFMLGREIPAYQIQPPLVGWVAPGSPAKRAGLQIGDRVVSVNEQRVDTWEQFLLKLGVSYDRALKIQVDREGQTTTCSLNATDHSSGEQSFGIYPPMPVRVVNLTPGYPAEKAGLQKGDLITAINEKEVSHWFQFSDIIHHSYDQELVLTVEREFGPIQVKVTPHKDVLQGGIGLIGIQYEPKKILRKYDFRKAVPHGFQETKKLLMLTLEFFKKLVLGQTSAKTIGGPIAIAQYAGDAAKSGSSNLLYFMAFLSLQLGVLNLLPVPILDGGLLLFLMIEAVQGHALSLRKREIAQQVGLSLILLLMVFAFYNDIMRLLG